MIHDPATDSTVHIVDVSARRSASTESVFDTNGAIEGQTPYVSFSMSS